MEMFTQTCQHVGEWIMETLISYSFDYSNNLVSKNKTKNFNLRRFELFVVETKFDLLLVDLHLIPFVDQPDPPKLATK